jgi:hypothetical protein
MNKKKSDVLLGKDYSKQFFRPVARLWVRGSDKNDGMILGTAFKGTRNVLKANTVYEITNVMGDLILREFGPSCVGNQPDKPGYGLSAEVIKKGSGKDILLTEDEWKRKCRIQK